MEQAIQMGITATGQQRWTAIVCVRTDDTRDDNLLRRRLAGSGRASGAPTSALAQSQSQWTRYAAWLQRGWDQCRARAGYLVVSQHVCGAYSTPRIPVPHAAFHTGSHSLLSLLEHGDLGVSGVR